ncbi:MAG: hypothetical protein PHU34_11750 [Candidatus Methanoperedens sp.]|nr:hypothetical protein [Candidatus Methanoperedens sp.]
MKAKEIAILIVFLLFTLPFLIRFGIWIIASTTTPSPEHIGKGAEFIAESAIPWWVQVIEWLTSLGDIGAYLIVGFIFFLIWIGEIKKR